MKNIFPFLLLLTLLYGCTPSSINLDIKKGLSSYPMFGKTGSRDFFVPVSIADSVSLKWEAEIHGSFPNSSITSYDNYIFINDLSGRVYCFNAANGKVIGALKHSGSVFTTPIINENNLIFIVAEDDESKSWLYYYNFSTGKELNEIEIPGRVLTELTKTENEIIFNTENGKVFSYNFFGEKLWEYETKEKVHSAPAYGNNVIVFGNDPGEIIGINAKNGSLLYKDKIGDSFFCGAAVDNNIVYIGNDNGSLYALGLSTGKMKWKFDTGARITMIPAFNENQIFIGNLKGEFYSVNRETGKLNWRTNTRGVLNASPLITKNIIILPDLNECYHFVDVKTGMIIKTFALAGRGKLTPVIFNEVLYIGYDDGILRAYEFIN